MDLQPGARLGAYEITAAIGAGGMGSVYRARDTRLDREVAIKVSSERFTERFDREARAIASLNHPNICVLHDVGPDYLVMELVEGESPRGPMPVDEALRIARQIAGALDAAHERGIVHRDLKPANIKVRSDGAVKVLDFGLAKTVGTEGAALTDNSPTVSMAATQTGVILGTAAYMSPEQARGRSIDKRADIWAFGVVLYELVTGKRLFEGEDLTETLAAVVMKEPDLSAVPPRIRRLLKKCLQKDPKQRLRDIADAWELLDDDAPAPLSPAGDRKSRLAPWIAAAAALAALSALALVHFREPAPPARQIMRFQMEVPGQTNTLGFYMALSPDGRHIVFTSNEPDGVNRLWIRSMDALSARMLPGTEGATSPYWSPDSAYVGFAVQSAIKKIEASGAAPPVTLGQARGLVGMGTWNRDGVIVFGNRVSNGGIMRISAAGGDPVALTKLDPGKGENSHSFPYFLPDGRHFLYWKLSSDAKVTGVYAGSIDMKPQDPSSARLIATSYGAIYVPGVDPNDGRILFLRDGTLMAQRFDAAGLKLTGEPFPVQERVGFAGSAGYFTASLTGDLAYRGGGGVERQLTWYDRKGAVIGRAGEAAAYEEVSMSPDGTRVAAFHNDGQQDVWLLDLARAANTRLTFDQAVERFPVWSRDGKQIAFCAGAGLNLNRLFVKSSDGSGEPKLLLEADTAACPQDWSPDGRFLLYAKGGTNTGSVGDALMALPLTSTGGKDVKPITFLATPFLQTQARFSPDGQWVVYVSSESGRPEVYVRPFVTQSGGAGGGKWMVSTGGGYQPRWRRDGKEILYLSGAGSIISVEVTANGNSFSASAPKRLFDAPVYPTAANAATATPYWDMTPDGQKFLINNLVGQSASPPLTVVLNWDAQLKN